MTTSGAAEANCQPDQSYLIAVVELEKSDRVFCQSDGCRHTIFRRVHIVLTGMAFRLLGSQCFRKQYGHLPLDQRTPQFGSAAGRPISVDERAMLLRNTAEFVAFLEAQELRHMRMLNVQQRVPAPPRSRSVTMEVTEFDGGTFQPPVERNALQYMWRRGVSAQSVEVGAARTNLAIEPSDKTILQYFVLGRWGDPWALAQFLLGRHGIRHEKCLSVLQKFGLIELLPAYAIAQRNT